MIARLVAGRAPALAGVLIWVATVLMLSGCATPQVSALVKQWPQDLATRVELSDVPFFAQDDYECGPAALAMVAGAAGVHLLPQTLVEQVYLPGRQGSLQVEMLAAGRRHGLVPYALKPDLEVLLREVAAGHPVLVFQNLAFAVSPVWHYAVVIGFDRKRNLLLLHSGRTQRMEMSLFTFERTWARAQNWAMVALPPTKLPATGEAPAYAQAVAALERVDPGSAQRAYATALKSWPDDLALLLGAGNAAYALGQREQAITAYRSALQRHADFADAWNNLAQALLDGGQLREAAQAAEQAVALGGPRRLRYQELLDQIRAQAGTAPM